MFILKYIRLLKIIILLHFVGKQTEYVALGGSGSTITKFVQNMDTNQGRQHIHHYKSKFMKAPIEAEGENEPQNPMNDEGAPIVELRPSPNSHGAITYYTNNAQVDGFIGSQDKSQMLDGDLTMKGIESSEKSSSYKETGNPKTKVVKSGKPIKVKIPYIFGYREIMGF